jgi:uncharacterized MnhB-related membrane protein
MGNMPDTITGVEIQKMENLQFILLIVGLLFFSCLTIVAKRVLSATLCLAAVSAMTSVILYRLGLYEVAVIELSVGAGLITVLLVYAVSVVGDDALDPVPIISRPLTFILTASMAILLGWMIHPLIQVYGTATGRSDLAYALWQQRVLDVYIQIALIFSGVLGVLGLVSEKEPFHSEKHVPSTSEISRTTPVEELHS